MKSFKQFLDESKYKWFSFSVEEFDVHIFFNSKEDDVIVEAHHKGVPLGGKYSAQLHKPHTSIGQEHIHVYARNNQ